MHDPSFMALALIFFFFFFEEPLLVPCLFSPSIGMKWVGEDHPTIIPYNLCHVHVISYFKYKTNFDGCEIFFVPLNHFSHAIMFLSLHIIVSIHIRL